MKILLLSMALCMVLCVGVAAFFDPPPFVSQAAHGSWSQVASFQAQGNSVAFSAGGYRGPIMIFRPDGTVWVDPDLKPDEAAKQVLDIIKVQLLKIRVHCADPHARESDS